MLSLLLSLLLWASFRT